MSSISAHSAMMSFGKLSDPYLLCANTYLIKGEWRLRSSHEFDEGHCHADDDTASDTPVYVILYSSSVLLSFMSSALFTVQSSGAERRNLIGKFTETQGSFLVSEMITETSWSLSMRQSLAPPLLFFGLPPHSM